MLIEGKHGRFRLNPHDTVIAASLRKYGEFAEHELMLLGTFLEENQTVIDVGANIGTHTIFFSKQVGENGSVVAIEAQPKIHELLLENISLNDCKNVSALNAAAGSAAGFLTAPRLDYDRDGNFGAFSFRLQDIGKYLPVAAMGEEMQVEVLPIDALDLENCDLIKIDAEGMERDILLGATRTIETHRPILYVENNAKEASSALIALIAELNYRACWHVISYFRADNFRACPDNIFPMPLELNMLCLPAEAGQEPVGLPPVTHPQQWLPDDLGAGVVSLDALLQTAESFG